MPADLPLEIWIQIAQYLRDDELRGAFTVNKALFYISMEHRWREVVLVSRDLPQAMHFLERLSDPFIAMKLKSIVLRLSKDSLPRYSRAVPNLQRRMRSSLASIKSALHHSHKPKFSEFVSEFIAWVPAFANVHELTIDTWDFPQTDDLSRLYQSCWASFGRNLESLTLIGNLDSYRGVILSRPMLSSALKYLRMDFTENNIGGDIAADSAILLNVVAPFVNNSSQHLEELKIWTFSRTLDISPLFAECNDFPRLEHLAVRMPFDKALHQPSGLKDLLWNTSKTLRWLEMRLNPSQFHMNAALEERLGSWLLQCLQNEQCLSRIQILDLYPSTTSDGPQVILASIRRASDTLRRLIIRDRYLVQGEALSVIDAAAECAELRYLRMNIIRLNIEVVDRMAERLPNLEGLWLSLGDNVSSNDATTLRSEFMTALAPRYYDKWKLKDLSLWQGGAEVSMDVMRRFNVTIPSVESFFERGHTFGITG